MFGKAAGGAENRLARGTTATSSRSLDDLMQLTFELWVVGMLLYYLALSALNLG